ncbi:MAG: PLDc N-terminal domain-containing protein [Anaerolineae bacterium]|nr:PLDc N-terminal domain-containing protein [Anaerolineae bacterium]
MLIVGNTFWNVFWILFFWIPVVLLWVSALVDIVRRADLSGWATAGWLLVIFIIPIIGALIYFATRPLRART